MITIIDATRTILFADDIAFQAMQAGILNLSAYADQILLELTDKTFKEVKKGTIVVALSRIEDEIKDMTALRPQVVIDDLSIKRPLCDITFNKTESARQKLSTLHQSISVDEHAFFTLTQSMSEVTIVAPQALLDDILKHFVEPPKAIYKDRVGITVRFSKEYLEVPNVLYTLQAALAVHKINFTEVISTFTEFSFIIDRENQELATQALQKFLR